MFILFTAVGLSGCGKDGAPASANVNSEFIDGGFEGAFISKTIECVSGNRATPVVRANELRRTMLIVSDHILITDSNSFEFLYGRKRESEPGMGMTEVVSRNYEVKTRSAIYGGVRDEIKVEISQPKSGAVSTTAASIEGQAVTEQELHPVSVALKNAESQTWIYFYADHLLHVYQTDIPSGVCSEAGASLHIAFENRKIN